jgi:hypothetical protein
LRGHFHFWSGISRQRKELTQRTQREEHRGHREELGSRQLTANSQQPKEKNKDLTQRTQRAQRRARKPIVDSQQSKEKTKENSLLKMLSIVTPSEARNLFFFTNAGQKADFSGKNRPRNDKL